MSARKLLTLSLIMAKIHSTAIVDPNVRIGEGTSIWHHVHVRENASLGKNCVVGKNSYIDHQVSIGNNVKIQNNCSVYHGVTIDDGVFVGPHVCFTNDKVPRAVHPDGTLKSAAAWEVSQTRVGMGASIGAHSVILPGVNIGQWAMVGAGSVVTKNVPDFGLVFGSPARLIGHVCKCGKKLVEKCSDCGISLGDIT